MEIAKIEVGRTTGVCTRRGRIPAGIVGASVQVSFTDPVWDKLIKTVVFRGKETRIAEFDGNAAVIPHEVVAEPGATLYFGIFGHDPDSDLQIPLIEVRLGTTEASTDANADPGTDPTLPIWAQLQQEIEDILNQGNALPEDAVRYAEQNPTEEQKAQARENIGALGTAELTVAVEDALAQAKESGEFDGVSGVYVGSGDMPEGYNVQIDPEGDAAPFFEEATIRGSKNLCHLGTVTFERGSGYLEIGSTLEEGKTYTLSAEVSSTDTDSATGVCAVYLATSANVMMSGRYTIARGSRASVTFVCPQANISKIVFYASGTTAGSTGDTATFAYIQIEEGSEATYFVPAESVKVLTAIDYVARKAIDDHIAKMADIVTKTRWLAIGDSITFGVYSYTNGEASATGVTDGWVRRLADALGYDITVMASRGMGYTAGVTGQDPNGGSARISLDTLLTRIEALEEDFNLITMAFGINDYATISQATLETIETGLDDAIERLMAKFPTARLVIITPFNSSRQGNTSTNFAYGYAYSGRSLKDIADIIKRKCESYGIECIYASNGFLINSFNISTLLPDNTHPSDYGHTLIAKNMARYLLN